MFSTRLLRMKIPRMKSISLIRAVVAAHIFAGAAILCPAGTLTDSFNTNVNYLTNGITGTIWDGVYFGAGEFNNSGVGGGGQGATIQCDANITDRKSTRLNSSHA